MPGHPGPGYRGPGYPGPAHAATQSPDRTRGWLIAISVIAGCLALGVCAGLGVFAARFVSQSGPETPDRAAATSASEPTGRPTIAPAGVTLMVPVRIDRLRASDDQSALVDGLLDQLRAVGMRQPMAGFYADPKDRDRPVVIWGAPGRFGHATFVIEGFFRGVAGEVGEVVGRRSVPPGPRGGTAECGHTGPAAAVEATVCVWVTDQALLAMMFMGRSIDSSTPWVAKIVSAAAKPG